MNVPRIAARLGLAFLLLMVLVAVAGKPVEAAEPGCRPYPVTAHSPTGIVGCRVYGEGTASMWGGPGAARNDCEYPWDDCQPIAVQSMQTGLVIQVTPTMYCGCWLGDGSQANDRIVDLDPSMVAALGLDPADGLWPVRVWPIDPASAGGGLGSESGGGGVDAVPSGSLPDTAVPSGERCSRKPSHRTCASHWTLIFEDQFNSDVPLGSFPATNTLEGRWGSYPYPWRDTSGRGTYSTATVVSVANGVLRKHLHDRQVAALIPNIPGADGIRYQTYGRYEVRFRADPVPGYKTAWLLWPKSETWPRDGELDFPEGNLDATIWGFVHHQGAMSGSDQTGCSTGARYDDWHTAVIEWTPLSVRFVLDGVTVCTVTSRIPDTPLRWVLQTETTSAPTDAAGTVEIDYVRVWSYGRG